MVNSINLLNSFFFLSKLKVAAHFNTSKETICLEQNGFKSNKFTTVCDLLHSGLHFISYSCGLQPQGMMKMKMKSSEAVASVHSQFPHFETVPFILI